MTCLVLAEHDNRGLSDVTARAVAAAMQLETPVHVLVAGVGCTAVAEAAACLHGVEKVLLADAPVYAHFLAEPLAAQLLAVAGSYDIFLAPATSLAKSVFPRVAAYLDVPQISGVSRIVCPGTFERLTYAGRLVQTVRAPAGKLVLTVRPSAFEAVASGVAAPIDFIPAGPDPGVSSFASADLSVSIRPDLATAKTVIAGGGGLQTKEQFQLLERIADRLKAAVGASRSAVDRGFLPNECQVGQTGKVIAPDLYFAVGISGAVQHLCGMKDARVVVAINKDEEAAIFQFADFGLVADAEQTLRLLDMELAQRGYA